MAQDIRELFKNEKVTVEYLPENHEYRFLKKLNEALPIEKKASKFKWYNIAASIVVLMGLSFGAYTYFQPSIKALQNNTVAEIKTKSLGDVSPDLKKVEDYYLASINLELSKVKYTLETKDLFDGYIAQLVELNKEYERLSLELNQSGPSKLTINALIDNLKLRLNLLYRLKEQLQELNTTNAAGELTSQSV